MGLIQVAAPSQRRIRPESIAFSALLGPLAALPTFGIDMILPSLSDTAALHVPPPAMGAAMGAYLLGFGRAMLVYGPSSNSLGRKPAITCGRILLFAGSLGCGTARTLQQFLLFRAIQSIGVAGPGMPIPAMVRDLFAGEAARARMSFVDLTINVVPMVAPTVGAGLMDLGGWGLIQAAPITAALVALNAIRHIEEPLRRVPSSGPAVTGTCAATAGSRPAGTSSAMPCATRRRRVLCWPTVPAPRWSSSKPSGSAHWPMGWSSGQAPCL